MLPKVAFRSDVLRRHRGWPHPLASMAASLTLTLAVLAVLAVLAGCGGDAFTPAPASESAPVPVPVPVVVVDPLAPALQTDLEKAAALYGISADGIGGDGSGDGGAAGGAGDGGPLKKAVVTLTDANGNQVVGQTDSNGLYLLKYQTKNFTAPLVLRVIDAGGNSLTSVTDESATTGKVIRASINPLTDKITSDVIPASVSGTDKTFDGSKVDLSKLVQAKADLVTSVNDGLKVAGIADTSKFDPVKSVYNYDGKGVDAVIESISHARDSGTGATQLRAKLQGVNTDANGVVITTLITASTPLATTSVALSTNPGLTFNKLNAYVVELNRCFALSPSARQTDVNCADSDSSRLVASNFRHNSRDLKAMYATLYSNADTSAVQGSVVSNPTLLYTTKSSGSSVDDIAVVEVTVNQPGTGSLVGASNTPIVYTTILVFRRFDTLTQAVAGNWILYGNQNAFDWSVEANYYSSVQTNPARQANAAGGSNFPSAMRSGLRVNFSTTVFDTRSRTYKPANVYAVRVKGPGLPANGVVWAPNGGGRMSILNKTGTIPAQGTLATTAQIDFRMAGVTLGTGQPLDPGVWCTTCGYNSDLPTGADFSQTQAYSRYQSEIYVNGSTTPIVEYAFILAPIQAPAVMANVPLHDLSGNTALITPPQAAVTSVTVQWVRKLGAARIESANAFFYSSGTFVSTGVTVADALTLVPSSTNAIVTNNTAGFPASAVTDFREVSVGGRSARAYFLNALQRTP